MTRHKFIRMNTKIDIEFNHYEDKKYLTKIMMIMLFHITC